MSTRIPGTRSRIDGQLHRWLPATITVRDMDPAAGEAAEGTPADTDQPLKLRLSVSSEAPYLRSSWWDEPWVEILGHTAAEVDLTRMNSGAAPMLANHDRYTAVGATPLAGIGIVERAWLEDDRLMADVTLSRREALEDLRQDIQDGLVRNVSVGYTINERLLTKAMGEGQPDEYRVTSWMPYEVSFADIPADATVGLGRSADGGQPPESTAPRYRVVDIPPAVGTSSSSGVRTMTTETQAPAAADPTAILTAERQRSLEIRKVGEQLNLRELATKAIDEGTSLDAFRALALDNLKANGSLRTAEAPDIGMSKKDVERFSFCRALAAASDPANAHKIAPFETECSRAAQDKRGDSRDKTREAAITIPVDVLRSGFAIDEATAAAALRMGGQNMQRALNVGTTTAGGNVVPSLLLAGSFIDLLRNAMILDRLGITWLRDLNGNIVIPSQTGAASSYWVAEGVAPSITQQTFGQMALTPHTIGAITDYSRKLLLQASIDVEAFVRMDLALQIGLGIQDAILNGTGSGAQPIGIANISGIGSVNAGGNGSAPAYVDAVALETAIASANADVGNMAYVTNAKVRGKLRTTPENPGVASPWVWRSTAERGIGEVLGYSAVVSNAVPSNGTQGASSGILSSLFFGNWADAIVGMWGGLDVLLDPYTGGAAGTRRVIALQDVDCNVRHVGSFAVKKDCLTS